MPYPPQKRSDGRGGAVSWLQYLFPVLGGGGAMIFMLVNPQPIILIGGAIFAGGSVLMGLGLYVQQRFSSGNSAERERDQYRDALERIDEEAAHNASAQHEAAGWRHPAPWRLAALAGTDERRWERRREDPDFLDLRCGVGGAPPLPPIELDAPTTSATTPTDPVCTAQATRLLERWLTIPSIPLSVPMAEVAMLRCEGDPGAARGTARAMVCEAAALHAPDDLRMVVAADPETAPYWEWTKWLPHVGDGRPAGLVVFDPAVLEQVLREEADVRQRELARSRDAASGLIAAGVAEELDPIPNLLLVLDGVQPVELIESLFSTPRDLGVSILSLGPAHPDGVHGPIARLTAHGAGAFTLERPAGKVEGEETATIELSGRADQLDVQTAEVTARVLARVAPTGTRPSRLLADVVPLDTLLGVPDMETIDAQREWDRKPLSELLVAPIGVAASGAPVELDLKEAALGGMGPHGLIVGATGSGKSELLRTLVMGLAVRHSPEVLALTLVDYKGGATFAPLRRLPHVAGLITNLQDDTTLVRRAYEALYGEQLRRQELLRRAGNLGSIHEYHERQAAGAKLPPLPYLLVIVDEFGELLAAESDFIQLFNSIGRLGRSLGMHLVLASQQLDEGRLRGLEGHLSYRICLRTLTAMESRTVIGVPDAYFLPPNPGSAYLKLDARPPQRFKVALVSQPYTRPDPDAELEILPFSPGPAPRRAEGAATSASAPSVLEVGVRRLAAAAPATHQVWLPPLPPTFALGRLLPDPVRTPERGLTVAGAGSLRAVLGAVDQPRAQSVDVLLMGFSGATGNLALVGGPQSGKSTLLRTLTLSLALTNTPQEAQLYAIDFGGGGLGVLDRLPHVGTVAGRREPDLCRRIVREVHAVVEAREELFRRLGIDSVQTFRSMCAAGEVRDARMGDVFLLLDNWGAISTELGGDLVAVVNEIGSRGLGYGVHLVLAANRWLEIKGGLRDCFGSRLELRLNDATESEVDRRLAQTLPVNTPGRGLTSAKLVFQAALPRLDRRATTDGLQEALTAAVDEVARAWTGPSASPSRVLPRVLDFADCPWQPPDGAVLLGLGESRLEPVFLDLGGADPHFLVFGDGESGKTNLLRHLMRSLSRNGPEHTQIVLIDYRRTLLEEAGGPALAAYAGSRVASAQALQEVLPQLSARLPGPEVTIEQLRNRSWWEGPEWYLIVDDYDLVGPNALPGVAELAAQGRDIGFHLILARRVGGSSRTMFEPLSQQLRDLGTQGLILSGNPQEGVLLGNQRPQRLPPGRGILVRGGSQPEVVQTPHLGNG